MHSRLICVVDIFKVWVCQNYRHVHDAPKLLLGRRRGLAALKRRSTLDLNRFAARREGCHKSVAPRGPLGRRPALHCDQERAAPFVVRNDPEDNVCKGFNVSAGGHCGAVGVNSFLATSPRH